MNKDLYISLITKKLSSELNTAELKDLNSWLNSSKDNAIVLQDFKNVWQASSGYKAKHAFNADSAFQSFANRYDIPVSKELQISSSTRSFFKFLVSSIAVITAILSIYFVYSTFSTQNMVMNENMHAMTVTLNEYSEVTLSPESSFKKITTGGTTNSNAHSASKKNLIDYNSVQAINQLNNSDNYLLNSFEGQGFFDLKNIHRNAPYILQLDNKGRVVAMDASFNIKNFGDEDQTIIDVQSGLILFEFNNSIHQLGEGERLVLNEKTKKISKVRTPDLNPFEWHKGILAFNNTPLDEVFNIIERFYGVDIEVVDNSPTTGHYTVSNMKPSSLNECLELLHSSIQMDIKRKGLRKIEVRNIKSN